MKVLKWFLIGFVAVLLILFAASQLLPGTYRAERSTTIQAPIELVYHAVTDLTVWTDWEPWGPTDDTMEVSYGEITAGEGASYSWEGKSTGTGTMTIIETEAPTRAEYKMVFNGEGLPAFATMELEPVDASTTKVTWSFHGELGRNPVSRYFGLLIDRMVGASFDAGLANLKKLCEEAVDPAVAPVAEESEEAASEGGSGA
jgi:uncharacterized protein YndB with AHSA1/START domain